MYKKLLLDKTSKISQKEQMKIIDFLFEKFVQYKKDTLFINDGVIKIVKSKQAFKTIARIAININFKIDILSFDDKAKKQKWLVRIDEIFDTITTINSFDLLRYKSNLFAKKQIVETDDKASTITVTTNKINIRNVLNNISSGEYKEILDDYKKHFKYFDELLNLIIDMRFAKDRKASFLHFRVKSNWGKSFLSGLLKNLEIAVEIDYHNLINKGTNDISPTQVRNSFVLILDEFNNFSQEMKKLSHEFTFAPKFGMSETVELYLKILFSAEKSPSFSGGVDPQIVNRVMVFELKDDETEILTNREIYLKFGNAKYMRVLEHYASQKMKTNIEKYLKMDEFEACKTADENVRKYFKKYKMNVEKLEKNIKNILEDNILAILNNEIEAPDFVKQNIQKITSDKYKGKYFIGNVTKVAELILKINATENEFKKMKYKITNISEILDVVEDCRTHKIRINGSQNQKRGLVIDIKTEKQIDVEIYNKNKELVEKTTLKNDVLTIDGNELF